MAESVSSGERTLAPGEGRPPTSVGEGCRDGPVLDRFEPRRVEQLLEDDPVRIRTTIPLNDEELRLTFDEQMALVDVTRD